jgi:hypothetical protein
MFVGLFICCLMIPHFLFESNEGGISNYGLYAKTVVPYTFALSLSGILTLIAARYAPDKHIKQILVIIGVLLIATLLSTYPYKVNYFLKELHLYVSTALLVAEFVSGLWFSLFMSRDILSLTFMAALLVGFVLIFMTYFKLLHILFIAELLTSIAFGALMVRTVEMAGTTS